MLDYRGPGTAARIGITPQGDRFTIQRWTAQLVAGGGLIGKNVLTTLSAPPRVTGMTLSVDEQPFATINADSNGGVLGSLFCALANAKVGP